MKEIFEFSFCGKTITIETGEMAKQASGSVLVRYDDTVILSTVTASKAPKELDFFPLTVTFEEKLYAVGKIPGGFLKREGRPSEHAILCSRLIDRPLRPLFADGFRNEVQVVNTVLSVDQDSSPEMMAMLGSSLALMISDIPFNGPIAGVYVGRVNGEFIINPTVEQSEQSDLELAIAGTKAAINMVEASAKEVSEEVMLEALMFGHEHIKQLIEFQEKIVARVGKEKREIALYEIDADIINQVEILAKDRLVEAVKVTKKLERYGLIAQIEQEVLSHFDAQEYSSEKEKNKTLKFVNQALQDIVKTEVRRLITQDKVRPDGRKIDEIRPLMSRVNLLPRVHGSAMFTRGETQVLSVCTLGALNEHQKIDGLTDQDAKRFMHHYNFPPYSVGETGRMGAPGRREVGHGALGERALEQIIPSEDVFPYTIRLVSEVLESNGSSSQASICASTMALMQAGVPIKAPVAGIAMGLVQQGDDYTILSDIQGMEDHLGDMDFKVAGTEKGIVALQMDIKIEGLSKEIFEEALSQAKIGRAHILENMLSCIDTVSDTLSPYAPKMELFYINPDKIRDVIGPGGKMINHIIDNSNNVKIDIEDDGKVVIYHTDAKAILTARTMIENITREAKVGEIYQAKVTRIEKFGAFLELFAGCDGLLHISKVANKRVEKVEDVLKLGDIIEVKVVKIDEKGRVDLVRNDLEPVKEEKPQEKGENNVEN